MADEYVEWKLSLLRAAAAVVLLEALELAVCLGGLSALGRWVASR